MAPSNQQAATTAQEERMHSGSIASETSGKKYATPLEAYREATAPKKPRFLTPKTFRAAINARLDNPVVTLFRLGARVLQLCFALAAGISYGVELSGQKLGSDGNSSFIYAEVVFGLTLVVLILDTLIVHSYHLTWMIEWVLSILWIALFGNFYTIYYRSDIEPQYAGVNVGNMKRIVWVDLINALLWMASALFSTTLCCSGVKAKIRGKKEQWRSKRDAKKHRAADRTAHEMEEGTVRPQPQEERLPRYEEVPLDDRS